MDDRGDDAGKWQGVKAGRGNGSVGVNLGPSGMMIELIEEKTNFEEQISSFEKNQFLWVELVKDFINSALEAHKIARAKNNGEELSFFAKKVGSNYFLSGRRFEFSPLRGFNALAAPPLSGASATLSLHDLRRWWDSNPR